MAVEPDGVEFEGGGFWDHGGDGGEVGRVVGCHAGEGGEGGVGVEGIHDRVDEHPIEAGKRWRATIIGPSEEAIKERELEELQVVDGVVERGNEG